MAGSTCPSCNQRTFYDNGSVKQCTQCNATGWGWNKGIEPGQGRGQKCTNCAKMTLHAVANLGNYTIRRCSTCDYSLVSNEN